MILAGTIPDGNEYEKFIPLFHPKRRWLAWLTGAAFASLALIMVLPDTLQAMVRACVCAWVGRWVRSSGAVYNT